MTDEIQGLTEHQARLVDICGAVEAQIAELAIEFYAKKNNMSFEQKSQMLARAAFVPDELAPSDEKTIQVGVVEDKTEQAGELLEYTEEELPKCYEFYRAQHDLMDKEGAGNAGAKDYIAFREAAYHAIDEVYEFARSSGWMWDYDDFPDLPDARPTISAVQEDDVSQYMVDSTAPEQGELPAKNPEQMSRSELAVEADGYLDGQLKRLFAVAFNAREGELVADPDKASELYEKYLNDMLHATLADKYSPNSCAVIDLNQLPKVQKMFNQLEEIRDGGNLPWAAAKQQMATACAELMTYADSHALPYHLKDGPPSLADMPEVPTTTLRDKLVVHKGKAKEAPDFDLPPLPPAA